MPGARMQARKTTHGLDRQHQYDTGQINGESASTVWPTIGSRTAKEQNRTVSM